MARLRKDRNEELDNMIRSRICEYMALRNYNKKFLTARLSDEGISRSTFYKHLRNPGSFRVSELRLIYDLLEVPKDRREY